LHENRADFWLYFYVKASTHALLYHLIRFLFFLFLFFLSARSIIDAAPLFPRIRVIFRLRAVLLFDNLVPCGSLFALYLRLNILLSSWCLRLPMSSVR
jgi:hypothetical protein